jgi:L-ribulokinase
MTLVAGIDFGTASVRVSIVDSERRRVGSGTAEYPVLRNPREPLWATQRPEDQ